MFVVRWRQPVGVKDGIRGGRETAGASGCTFGFVAEREPRRPGIRSRRLSRIARNAAHVTHNTPRNSGSRDCGSAGYGLAPVKRRRRPVTDVGVGTRFVDSLIDLPRKRRADPSTRRRVRRDHCDDEPKPRRARWPFASVGTTGGEPCRSHPHTGLPRSERLAPYSLGCRKSDSRARAIPTRRTRRPHR